VPALLSVKFDEGPFGPAVMVVFFGMPLWVVATSVGLLRGHGSAPAVASSPV
jgi:hypothetical protein